MLVQLITCKGRVAIISNLRVAKAKWQMCRMLIKHLGMITYHNLLQRLTTSCDGQ